MSAPGVPSVSLTDLTPAQRRRATALVLVRLLWPNIGAQEGVRRAAWIVNGYGAVDPPDGR